jgi:cytochrome c peroxidase
LRNVALTAPYMHDGSEATLRDVVEFYNKGGAKNEWLSEEIKPLDLTEQEITALVAFMEALTANVTNADPPRSLPK